MSETAPTPKPLKVIEKIVRTPLMTDEMLQPKARDVLFCTFPGTHDGWLAAWVLRSVAHRHAFAVEFASGAQSDFPDLSDRQWVAIGGGSVDAAPVPNPPCREMLVIGALGDHDAPAPLPFSLWERSLPFGVVSFGHPHSATGGGARGSTYSLAASAWDFFMADRVGFDARPRLINYVEDHASPSPRLQDTAAVMRYLQETHKGFQALDRLIPAVDDGVDRRRLIAAGKALLRWHTPRES